MKRSAGLSFPSICCSLISLSLMESRIAESLMLTCRIAFGMRPEPQSTQLRLSFHTFVHLFASAKERSCITFLIDRMRFTNSSVAFISASELLRAGRSCRTHDHVIGPPERKIIYPDMDLIFFGWTCCGVTGSGADASCGPQFASLKADNSWVS